jgi:molybdenum cofactor cytidylyltransferase
MQPGRARLPVAPEPVPAARLAGIVLAAGAGARFGGVKQLARLGDLSLVERAVRLARGVCGAGVVVVTGAHARQVEGALAGLAVTIAHNPDWARGLSGSLRCGVTALPAGAEACLVLLCDQPAIAEDDLRRLVDAWSRAPLRAAAAHYQGALGVPAIFPAAHWAELMALEGDQGARRLLARLPDVTAVPMPRAAFDVDVPGDLVALPRS